jgi:hypothetical protein
VASRGSDEFGRISGRRSSEINEIGCAVSVLAWHSPGASLERLKREKTELLGRVIGMRA